MYDKFSIATVIAFAAAIAAVSGAAATQNQTSTMPASTAAPNITLDSIKDLYLSVWNQTKFNSTFSTFVEPYSAAGYGVNEEHGASLRPAKQ